MASKEWFGGREYGGGSGLPSQKFRRQTIRFDAVPQNQATYDTGVIKIWTEVESVLHKKNGVLPRLLKREKTGLHRILLGRPQSRKNHFIKTKGRRGVEKDTVNLAGVNRAPRGEKPQSWGKTEDSRVSSPKGTWTKAS